ncbi:MAG: FtsH protease activity modulator HflK [Candidatus Omnitrophica bacterium]|nr:FtsH protease activity modulator HflK [Candidatus Omnitrophota bacterium]
MEISLPRGGGFRNVPDPQRLTLWVLIIGFTTLTATTVFYKVEPEEVGVVQQFGKFMRIAQPGLHIKLPFGIETVRLVRTLHVQSEEFGFQTTRAAIRSQFAEVFTGPSSSRRGESLRSRDVGFESNSFLHESMMLTGDLNLAVVEWIVQYRHADPYKYLFKIRDADNTVRDMSETVMRQVVGDRTVDEVITLSRVEIQEEAKQELQKILDKLESGIEVSQVVLQSVNPPDEVKPSFNDVNTARQDKERMINQAWEDYNKFVPRAQGEAEQIIREAEGFALKRVNNAEGDVKKFTSMWTEYKQAPEIARRRMYLEAMQDLYRRIPNKIIIDKNLKGVLPFMDLNQIFPSDQLNQKKEGGQPS